jgi:sugar phosphate isomerase/epimerase
MSIKVGLILYSVREAMTLDPLGTVEKVAKLGYKNIEVCNHNAAVDSGIGFGVNADELKAIFDKFGSKVISAHIFPFEKSDIKAVLAYNKTLKNTNIVNPMGRFTTYDDLMLQCEYFNKIGHICREEGMNYLYHNHNHEYRTFNGKSILDLIVDNTDPEYLSLELDTFWTMRAGLDPVEILKHFGKRVKLIHQKDFAWDSIVPINTNGLTSDEREIKPGEDIGLNGDGRSEQNETERLRNMTASRSAFTEIGTGIMHIQDIIDAANMYSNADYIILEQDATRMPSELDSVKKSMESFRKFTGISWDN